MSGDAPAVEKEPNRLHPNAQRSSTKMAARAVRTGRIRDGMVEVVEGLTVGENVEATRWAVH
jgi:hypothetical protein